MGGAARSSGSEQLQMPVDLYGRADCVYRNKHDGATYIWLAYSLFFFIEPIMRHSRTYWMRQLPWYFVFLVLYVSFVEFTSQRVRVTMLAGMFVLGVMTIPHNAGGASFFIYVAAMLAFCVESAAVLWVAMVVECLTLAVENHVYPGNPFNYMITGMFVFVVGISNLYVARSKRADARLRAAQQENLALAAVAERERIARDLHDVLGHTLSLIVLKAELAGRLMGRDDARAAAEIADVEKTARTALAEVREAIGGYRAKGLMAELDKARMTLDAAGVLLRCDTKPPVLPAREETVLSLALREAVTNIVRHARATECRMAFGLAEDGFVMMEVSDNGGGEGAVKEGNGLRGMRERVQELGGRFRAVNGGGMKLVVEVPGQEPRQEHPDAGRAVHRTALDASHAKASA